MRPKVPSKVRPGMAQARPQGAPPRCAPKVRPQGAPGAPLGAPWDSAGAPGEAKARLGCARAHTGMAQARPQGAPGASLGAPWDNAGAPGGAKARLGCHQRFSSSPYRRAQGARWAGLTASGCALCGRKSLPRRTLGWHRRAPKPQGAPGAPLGAPWDITGAPGEVQRRTLARPGPTPAGHGRTPEAHLELRWVWVSSIYIFASLSGLQSRHGLHRQLLQHAATEASMCTAAYAQLVDEASTGERRASTGCVLCRGIHWRWRWWERQQQRMYMVHQAHTPHLNRVQAGVCTPSPKRS